MAKTVFITGASKGFGRIWTEALLERGDRVAATSRNIAGLEDIAQRYSDRFLPIQLDITDRDAAFEAVAYANDYFVGLDVVINNAGYGVFGAIEEASEADVRGVFEANVFGTLWVTQAVIPIFREQGNGHIIQLSSVLGIWSLPTLGIYNATKFAVEGMSEALAEEVRQFGIDVTLIEPNGYATEFGGNSAVVSEQLAAYDNTRVLLGASDGMQPQDYGQPLATVPALFELIDSPEPPLRLFLGNLGYRKAAALYANKLQTWSDWNHIAVAAHG